MDASSAILTAHASAEAEQNLGHISPAILLRGVSNGGSQGGTLYCRLLEALTVISIKVAR